MGYGILTIIIRVEEYIRLKYFFEILITLVILDIFQNPFSET